MRTKVYSIVIPAKAGIHNYSTDWIPAFAGMTDETIHKAFKIYD